MSFLRMLDEVYCVPWLLIALWPALELWRQSAAWRALHAMPSASIHDDNVATTNACDDSNEAIGFENGIETDINETRHSHRFGNVDVLQPIRSGDPTLGEALGASLRALGARDARLHWLIDEDDIAAASIVSATIAAQPALAAMVEISLHPACPAGINPKLFKLDRALAQCSRDTVLVLDDDARLPPATLDALLAALQDNSDDKAPVASTALPAYLPASGLGARLLARFVNDNSALTYLPPRLAGHSPTLNGMCWAMRREALLRIGGFAPRLRHLTDDLAMAQAVLAAGGRIDQRSEPVWMRTALPDLRAYTRQMHRWMLFAHLLLRGQPRPMRLRIGIEQGLPVVLPLFAFAIFALAPSWFGGVLIALGACAHVFGRRRLQRACAGSATAKTEPLLSLCIVALLPLHALHAWLDRRIRWRTHCYRVYANDRFEDCA
jgi:ceramide glucosyltransferase